MMLLFKSALLALALLPEGAEASLRSSSSSSSARKLSNEFLAGYEPRTIVTDHAAVDKDLIAMESLLESGDFVSARRIYELGAHSRPTSVLTVTDAGGLASELPKGTPIRGTDSSGAPVEGIVAETAGVGAGTLKFQYSASRDQETYVRCVPNAYPTPVLDGCLAPNGTVQVGSQAAIGYEHDPSTGVNGRTLQGFSLQAEAKMFDCGKRCPYQDFSKFYNYYGQFDYGNQWITNAFDRVETSFAHGNADFRTYEENGLGLTEVIQKGAAYMNVWMYVIREFEDAIDDCEDGCQGTSCNDEPVAAWDEGVAFYVGSTADGVENGVMPFALAEKRCVNFKTCGEGGDSTTGRSKINDLLLAEFARGQAHFLQGQCPDAEKSKERISQLMSVPLIQGTLRYAYITSTESAPTEAAKAEGAVFAASVLPVVHHCNAEDAKTIYDNMRVGAGTPDFKAVKKAFEKNYDCMGITCADVGGLYDSANERYYDGASPCSGGGNDVNIGLAVGIPVAIVVALLIGFVACKNKKSSDVEFTK